MRQIYVLLIVVVSMFTFVIQVKAEDIIVIDELSAFEIMSKSRNDIGELVFDQVLFSPADKQIIILVNLEMSHPNYEIWQVNTDGTNLKTLFKPPRQIPGGRKLKKESWKSSMVWISDISYSPNGGYIVFEMYHTIVGYKHAHDIYIIKKDGTGLFRVTETPDIPKLQPFFLEDNKTIFYTTVNGKNLCSVRIDGAEDKELPIEKLSGFAIHPSGKIIWEDFKNNIWKFHIKNVKAPKVKILSSETVKGIGRFKWSRDGKKIMYTKEENGEDWVYIMDEDGKNNKKIIRGRGGDWSWDDKKIIYYDAQKVINPKAIGWRKERWISTIKIHTLE